MTGSIISGYVAKNTDLTASRIIPSPRSPDPRPALIKTGSAKRTSIIPWTTLILTPRIIPRSNRKCYASRHNAHSHPHGDEYRLHIRTRQGQIKPSKKMTKTGSKP